ncbi:tetratricopeptide repeat protein [Pseudooceanicola onchidii]|uniref:tetratricopeptide repeat protein n=1 Tax=Pseudooceanicola onchidii TaxID=2562279 RepID=UPI001F0EFD0F|nr:tetratricopeptide repeat protein [Pseudooceanicola onchidii]
MSKTRLWRAVTMALALTATTTPVMAGNSGDYLAARQARLSSDFDAAVYYYIRALGADPRNPQLLEGSALSQLSAGDLPRAVAVSERMEDAGIESQISQAILAAHDFTEGDFQAVLDRVAADKGVGPLVDGLMVAWAQLGAGDMSKALAAFDDVAETKGMRGFALYHKALALAMVGDFEGSEAIYSGDDERVQMTRRGAMARIEVLSQLDRNDDALAMLDRLFGTDLDPGLTQMREDLGAGKTLPFTHVTKVTDGVAEIFFSVAAALRGEATDDYTLIYSRVAEALRNDHVDAILLSAELLEDMGQPDLATRAYRRVPQSSPAFHVAELGRADALRKAGRDDAALEVLDNLAVTYSDLPIVHTTRGDVLRGMDRYVEAIQAYDRSLSLYASDDPGQWFVLYVRGISHERLNHWPEAETDFRDALALNPGHPRVLNYLGYSLVEKQQNLDEALDMIERAAAARPDSGYILDSLGWALYRLGRYDESVGHMERAAELMPVDPVVTDHLGDVYWAVGRLREAQFQWNRALSFDPEDKDATRIRRKLKVGLDAVLAEEGSEPLKVAQDGTNGG